MHLVCCPSGVLVFMSPKLFKIGPSCACHMHKKQKNGAWGWQIISIKCACPLVGKNDKCEVICV